MFPQLREREDDERRVEDLCAHGHVGPPAAVGRLTALEGRESPLPLRRGTAVRVVLQREHDGRGIEHAFDPDIPQPGIRLRDGGPEL